MASFRHLLQALALFLLITFVRADDWPEWRGAGRLGVWNETGILSSFPADGLRFEWRTPIHAGYSGPAAAAGHVYVTDFQAGEGKHGTERALCLDETTGRILWTHEWDADYTGISYEIGPRATPTVDGERVYCYGARGVLQCLRTDTGAALWKKDFIIEYGEQPAGWGTPSAPLVDGPRLICVAGAGRQGAALVALDKLTGRELWRAIQIDGDAGYGQPVIFQAGGVRQLIFWSPKVLYSLNPETGAIYWQHPFTVKFGQTVMTPVLSGNRLLVSGMFEGTLLLELDADHPAEHELWRGHSSSEINTDGLHALTCTPTVKGDYLYGICSYGQFRCLDLRTGQRVWESQEVVKEKARWATGFIVRNGDRYFINNDRGELILADLEPDGYHELGRTPLIRPTNKRGGRRELGAVNWTHPAYANRHIFTRNDEEILSASLAAEEK